MLSTVEFTEARRGADRNEVASFLREVARGVAGLERQIADANARADAAEQRLREAGGDEELRRTLVMAQRTADATLADARSEAEKITVAANERAARIMAEADAEAAGMRAEAEAIRAAEIARASRSTEELLADAEAEVRRTADELRAHLQQQNLALSERRALLLEDVRALEGHLEAQRRRLQSAVDTIQYLIDSPEGLAALDAPPTSVIEALDALEAAEMEADAMLDAAAIMPPPDPSTLVGAGSSGETMTLEDFELAEPTVTVDDEVDSGDDADAEELVMVGAQPVEWPEIDETTVVDLTDEPITAEVPLVPPAPSTVVIDVRDEVITGADVGRQGDDRRWRFGRRG